MHLARNPQQRHLRACLMAWVVDFCLVRPPRQITGPQSTCTQRCSSIAKEPRWRASAVASFASSPFFYLTAGRGNRSAVPLRLQPGIGPPDEQPHQDSAGEGREIGGVGKRSHHQRARPKPQARRGVHKKGARPARCGRGEEGQGQRKGCAAEVQACARVVGFDGIDTGKVLLGGCI